MSWPGAIYLVIRRNRWGFGFLLRFAWNMVKSKEVEFEVKLRIILEAPPAGVDFGLQRGKGEAYDTIQKQRSNGRDLYFNFAVTIRKNRQGGPSFLGPFIQGPP